MRWSVHKNVMVRQVPSTVSCISCISRGWYHFEIPLTNRFWFLLVLDFGMIPDSDLSRASSWKTHSHFSLFFFPGPWVKFAMLGLQTLSASIKVAKERSACESMRPLARGFHSGYCGHILVCGLKAAWLLKQLFLGIAFDVEKHDSGKIQAGFLKVWTFFCDWIIYPKADTGWVSYVRPCKLAASPL